MNGLIFREILYDRVVSAPVRRLSVPAAAISQKNAPRADRMVSIRAWISSFLHTSRTTDGLLVATTLMACCVAMGSVVGVVAVSVSSVIWLAMIMVIAVREAPAFRRLTLTNWLAVFGIGLAILRMTSLGLVQLFESRDALSWNVDWRYTGTQAHSISRFAGTADSTDYAGVPINYHAGPGWIAGALNNTLGLSVNQLLFIVIPALCMLVFVVAAYRLLTVLGASGGGALLAVATVVNLPSNPYRLLYDIYTTVTGRTGASALLNAESWLFTPNLMPNSLLGLTVGFLGLWGIVRSRNLVEMLLGCLCVASVVALKPQYFIGFVVVGGAGFLVLPAKEGGVITRRHIGMAAAMTTLALAFSAISRNPLKFNEVAIDFHPLLSGWQLARQSLVVLAIGVVAALVLTFRKRRMRISRTLLYASGACVGYLILYMSVEATTVLLDTDQVALATSTGLDYARSSQDPNFAQVLLPGVLCICLLALGSFVTVTRSLARPRVLVALAAGSVVFALPITIAPVISPTGPSAYEVAEESSLVSLMRKVDVSSGRWISSDLADPAQDFARPLRATTLTYMAPAQFYVANVAYLGFTQPDASQRVERNDRFFSTLWSPWHAQFLRSNGVRYVLVRDRCPAAWGHDTPELALRGTQGAWKLFEVASERSLVTSVAPSDTFISTSGSPRYGQSDCRTGGTTSH